MSSLAMWIKMQLIDQHGVTVLMDMTSPASLNGIEGKKVTFTARHKQLIPRENLEEDWDYAKRIVADIYQPDMDFFALYELTNDGIRFASVENPFKEMKNG